jgi:PPM family protein phosphatase
LIDAFSRVNARVFARSGNGEDRVSAGTSLTAAVVFGGNAYMAHVGRTRAYLERDGGLAALTADDEIDRRSWLRPRGNVPTEAFAGHVLTRSLGTQPTLDPSVGTFRLMHGDVLILATSVFHAVPANDITRALNAESATDVAQRLLQAPAVREAYEGGTVVVGRALTASSWQYERQESGVADHPARLIAVLALVFVLTGLLLEHSFW